MTKIQHRLPPARDGKDNAMQNKIAPYLLVGLVETDEPPSFGRFISLISKWYMVFKRRIQIGLIKAGLIRITRTRRCQYRQLGNKALKRLQSKNVSTVNARTSERPSKGEDSVVKERPFPSKAKWRTLNNSRENKTGVAEDRVGKTAEEVVKTCAPDVEPGSSPQDLQARSTTGPTQGQVEAEWVCQPPALVPQLHPIQTHSHRTPRTKQEARREETLKASAVEMSSSGGSECESLCGQNSSSSSVGEFPGAGHGSGQATRLYITKQQARLGERRKLHSHKNATATATTTASKSQSTITDPAFKMVKSTFLEPDVRTTKIEDNMEVDDEVNVTVIAGMQTALEDMKNRIHARETLTMAASETVAELPYKAKEPTSKLSRSKTCTEAGVKVDQKSNLKADGNRSKITCSLLPQASPSRIRTRLDARESKVKPSWEHVTVNIIRNDNAEMAVPAVRSKAGTKTLTAGTGYRERRGVGSKGVDCEMTSRRSPMRHLQRLEGPRTRAITKRRLRKQTQFFSPS